MKFLANIAFMALLTATASAENRVASAKFLRAKNKRGAAAARTLNEADASGGGRNSPKAPAEPEIGAPVSRELDSPGTCNGCYSYYSYTFDIDNQSSSELTLKAMCCEGTSCSRQETKTFSAATYESYTFSFSCTPSNRPTPKLQYDTSAITNVKYINKNGVWKDDTDGLINIKQMDCKNADSCSFANDANEPSILYESTWEILEKLFSLLEKEVDDPFTSGWP